MTTNHFPDQISPLAFAQLGKHIQHTFSIEAFERAATMLVNDQGEVTVTLHFSRDELDIPTLSGTLSATVALGCQRCMKPMEVNIESSIHMALIRSEDEERTLPESYEPLLVDEKAFSLLTFIEDELILAIPVVANHPESHCSATQFLRDRTKLAAEKKADNPFQILEQLKEQP
ncbi:MAG: hypothetical protein HN842_07560 [Gammaproteobacteria bacterium]|jgi:uncharacterized protein|nr:hypothetical protein [Gammaproteobacteria bacterium]